MDCRYYLLPFLPWKAAPGPSLESWNVAQSERATRVSFFIFSPKCSANAFRPGPPSDLGIPRYSQCGRDGTLVYQTKSPSPSLHVHICNLESECSHHDPSHLDWKAPKFWEYIHYPILSAGNSRFPGLKWWFVSKKSSERGRPMDQNSRNWTLNPWHSLAQIDHFHTGTSRVRWPRSRSPFWDAKLARSSRPACRKAPERNEFLLGCY